MPRKDPHICSTPRCRKARATGYTKCHSCNKRAYAASHPVEYHYNALRCNARRRGKAFSLTLEEYRQFAAANGLFDSNGQKRTNRTIDRIDPDRGYHADNIQVLTTSENTRKRYVDYHARQIAHGDMEAMEAQRQRERELAQEIENRRAAEPDWLTPPPGGDYAPAPF